jgi:type II secretory pathway component GspD/PulD (secretin)
MRATLLRVVILLALSGAALAAERMVTEVIAIGYRDAREVVAMLRPLIPPPGTVTSLSDQLIVKTTPSNLAEIKRLLQSIDKAPVNLLVSVKHTLDEEVRRDLAEVFAEFNSGDSTLSAGVASEERRGLSASATDGESSAQVRVIREEGSDSARAAQQIRVLEGGTAFIASGESRPVKQKTTHLRNGQVTVQESVGLADARTGFYVRPRLSGDRVILDISSTRNRFHDTRIESREARTTVSAPLGRWIAVSAASESDDRAGVDIGRIDEQRRDSRYTVYLKVTKLSD